MYLEMDQWLVSISFPHSLPPLRPPSSLLHFALPFNKFNNFLKDLKEKLSARSLLIIVCLIVGTAPDWTDWSQIGERKWRLGWRLFLFKDFTYRKKPRHMVVSGVGCRSVGCLGFLSVLFLGGDGKHLAMLYNEWEEPVESSSRWRFIIVPLHKALL